jgi:hypothetical protein
VKLCGDVRENAHIAPVFRFFSKHLLGEISLLGEIYLEKFHFGPRPTAQNSTRMLRLKERREREERQSPKVSEATRAVAMQGQDHATEPSADGAEGAARMGSQGPGMYNAPCSLHATQVSPSTQECKMRMYSSIIA